MKKRLRIVSGNDFYLEVPVKNIVFVRDTEGRISKSELDVPLSSCSVLNVNIVCECGNAKATTFTVNGSSLMVKVEGSIPCGWYGLEVTYKLAGRQYRSFERDVFKIVENNGKSFVSGEQYAGEQSYQVDTMWTLMSIIDEADLKAIIADEVELQMMLNSPIRSGNGEMSARLYAETAANGDRSFAVGFKTIADGFGSFAEGQNNQAYASFSHVGGNGCQSNGAASFVFGNNLRTSHVGEFALGVVNDYEATGGDGEDDYLIGSVGGGYRDGFNVTRKNILELWRNGSMCIQVNGEKVRLQDEILRLWTLVDILKDKEVIADSDFVVTDDAITEVVNTYSPVDPRDTTLDEQHFGSAWGVLPKDNEILTPFTGGHGMLPADEVGEKLSEEAVEVEPPSYNYTYYGGSLGSYDYIPEEETTH